MALGGTTVLSEEPWSECLVPRGTEWLTLSPPESLVMRGMLWEAGDVEGEWNRDPVKSELFLLIWPRLHTGKLRFLNQHSVHKVLMRGIKFKGINAAEV